LKRKKASREMVLFLINSKITLLKRIKKKFQRKEVYFEIVVVNE